MFEEGSDPSILMVEFWGIDLCRIFRDVVADGLAAGVLWHVVLHRLATDDPPRTTTLFLRHLFYFDFGRPHHHVAGQHNQGGCCQ